MNNNSLRALIELHVAHRGSHLLLQRLMTPRFWHAHHISQLAHPRAQKPYRQPRLRQRLLGVRPVAVLLVGAPLLWRVLASLSLASRRGLLSCCRAFGSATLRTQAETFQDIENCTWKCACGVTMIPLRISCPRHKHINLLFHDPFGTLRRTPMVL